MTPERWRRGKLGEIAEIVTGQSPPGDAYNSEGRGVPLLNGPTEFGPSSPTPVQWTTTPTKFAEPGDVLFCVRGSTTGRQNIADQRYCIGRGLAAVRGRPVHSVSSYLRFVLGDLATDVLREAKGAGSTFPNITSERLFERTVLLPPLGEQRKIAAILSSVDDAIEATQAVIEQLQVVKKAMMAELLTRGLPGRHTRFKMTEIGEIPEGWEVVTLGSLSTFVTSGSRGWAQFYADEGALFLRITNLKRGTTRLDLSDRQHVRLPEGSAEGTRTRVEPGDVLVSITADLGIIGLVPPVSTFSEAYVNQHVALVRLESGRCDPRYIASVLAGDVGQAQVRRLNDGGAKAGLNLASVRQLLVPLPRVEEQRALAEPLERLEDRLALERETLTASHNLKAALMSVLLTGEVRVKPDEQTT